MADETTDPDDEPADAGPPATAGFSGFARIVDAMLVAPDAGRRRGNARLRCVE